MQSKVTGEKGFEARCFFFKLRKASKTLVPRKNKTHLPKMPVLSQKD